MSNGKPDTVPDAATLAHRQERIKKMREQIAARRQLMQEFKKTRDHQAFREGLAALMESTRHGR